MKAKISKREIENIIKRHVPKSKPLKWDSRGLWLNVDECDLKKDSLNGMDVWIFDRTVYRPANYLLCPYIESKKTKYYLVIQ